MAESHLPNKSSSQERFLLGRLFIVPLIIVAVVVTCTVVVVISFGAISSSRQLPISKVLATLEANPGEKTAGMMMPQAKETWQAAQELALRLDKLETEVSAEELPAIQSRLARLLEGELASSSQLGEMGRQRLTFIMHAAAKARSAEAVPLFVNALKNEDRGIRREAVGALAMMRDVPGVRAQLLMIGELLRDTTDPVVRMVTCAALSKLATSDDAEVIESLTRAYHVDEDQDVRWNAALTLARLGSSESVPTLSEMLTREYWLRQRVHYKPAVGAEVDRPFTPNLIDEHLIVTMDATRGLDDQIIWQYIEKLEEDTSLKVAAKARLALAERPAPGS